MVFLRVKKPCEILCPRSNAETQENWGSKDTICKPRIRAFAEFTRRYGVEELEKCLLRNKDKGVVYHYEGQLVGG